MRPIVLMCAAVAIAGGCGRSDPEPRARVTTHPLLEQLEPPPVNTPLTSLPLPGGTPQLPADSVPALTVSIGGRPVAGPMMRKGRLMVGDGRIELAGTDAAPVEMLFRLPRGLPALPAFEGDGSITIADAGVSGPNRQVYVQASGTLMLARVQHRSYERINIDVGRGVRLVQQAVASSEPGALYAPVATAAFDGDRPLGSITAGAPAEITSPAGAFHVFIGSSRWARASEPPSRGTYVLDAWIVRAR